MAEIVVVAVPDRGGQLEAVEDFLAKPQGFVRTWIFFAEHFRSEL